MSHSGVPHLSSMPVYTKKLHKSVYHLATFNEPLQKEAVNREFPAHVIELPAADVQGDDGNERDNYQNVHQFVRRHNRVGQDYNDLGLGQPRSELPQTKKPVLVYEEKHSYPTDQPTKFYGYRDKYKSKDDRSEVPNYALLIYDVSRDEMEKPRNRVTKLDLF